MVSRFDGIRGGFGFAMVVNSRTLYRKKERNASIVELDLTSKKAGLRVGTRLVSTAYFFPNFFFKKSSNVG